MGCSRSSHSLLGFGGNSKQTLLIFRMKGQENRRIEALFIDPTKQTAAQRPEHPHPDFERSQWQRQISILAWNSRVIALLLVNAHVAMISCCQAEGPAGTGSRVDSRSGFGTGAILPRQ
jgi:hypothetical protein